MTSDLVQCAHRRRESLIDGFTKKYGCKTLVWFEQHEQMHTAPDTPSAGIMFFPAPARGHHLLAGLVLGAGAGKATASKRDA